MEGQELAPLKLVVGADVLNGLKTAATVRSTGMHRVVVGAAERSDECPELFEYQIRAGGENIEKEPQSVAESPSMMINWERALRAAIDLSLSDIVLQPLRNPFHQVVHAFRCFRRLLDVDLELFDFLRRHRACMMGHHCRRLVGSCAKDIDDSNARAAPLHADQISFHGGEQVVASFDGNQATGDEYEFLEGTDHRINGSIPKLDLV